MTPLLDSRLTDAPNDDGRGGKPLRPLRVVIAHNRYLERGGEDAVVDAEVALLRRHGHEVHEYQRDNEDIQNMSRASVAADTLWSRRTVNDISALCRSFRPDIVHVHNSLPLISPSIYWAAAKSGVPVVQTLHNFRLMCPQAFLLREGKVCEDCVGKVPWRGVVHGCYRGSSTQTAVLAGMVTGHRALGTWQHKISRYIALNEFCRQKFIEGGLPAHKIVVKPNFIDLDAPSAVPPPGAGSTTGQQQRERDGFLFVGRLSPEKGTAVLAAAARSTNVKLRVVGTGQDHATFEAVPGIEMVGALKPDGVYERMRESLALVMPSLWYENFPRTLVEAFACGLPVIASRIGALATLVTDNVNGLLFEPGNSTDLEKKLAWAKINPQRMAEMGARARAHYESCWTGSINYTTVMDIYAAAARNPVGAGT